MTHITLLSTYVFPHSVFVNFEVIVPLSKAGLLNSRTCLSNIAKEIKKNVCFSKTPGQSNSKYKMSRKVSRNMRTSKSRNKRIGKISPNKIACRTGVIFEYFRRTEAKARRERNASRARGEERTGVNKELKHARY